MLQINVIRSEIRSPRTIEAQVRIVAEALGGVSVRVQATNLSRAIEQQQGWVSVHFADQTTVYFQIRGDSDYERIERVIQCNGRITKLAQRRKRPVRYLSYQPPSGAGVKAYEFRIIGDDGLARSEIVAFGPGAVQDQAEEPALAQSCKVCLTARGQLQRGIALSAGTVLALDAAVFQLFIGSRGIPVRLLAREEGLCMELLEKIEPESAADQSCVPCLLSLGTLEIPLKELCDLRPGTVIELDGQKPGEAQAWIQLGLDQVAAGRLRIREGRFEFTVDSVELGAEAMQAG